MASKKLGKTQGGEPEMDDLITIAEAAELRGVSVSAIGELVRRKRIRSWDRFGRKLVSRTEVREFQRQRAGWPKGRSRKGGQ